MANSRVAQRYAIALESLTKEQKNPEIVSQNLELVRDVVSSSRELKMFLKSPIVKQEKKKNALEELFSSKIEKNVMEYLTGIIQSKRIDILEDILLEYFILRDEVNGIKRVEIKTATEITPEQSKNLISSLEKMTNKNRSNFIIDENLKVVSS